MSYYEVLQVADDASPNEIRAAYLRLVQRHHPDRHVGEATEADRDMFKQIQEAYEVLFNAEQRRLYDNQRSIPKPRERGPVVTPAYRGSAAATQPINPGVRRDVPDDWLRRGGSSGAKKKPIRTLVFVAILIGLATTVVPQCSQYMEQHIGMEEITIPEFNSALGPPRSPLPTMALFSRSLEAEQGSEQEAVQSSNQSSDELVEKEDIVELAIETIEDGKHEFDAIVHDEMQLADEAGNEVEDVPVEQAAAKKEVAPFKFSIDPNALDFNGMSSNPDSLFVEDMGETNPIDFMGTGETSLKQSRLRSMSRLKRPLVQLDDSQGFINDEYQAPAVSGNYFGLPTWREQRPLATTWDPLTPKSPAKNRLLPSVATVDMSLPLTGQQDSTVNDPGTHAWSRDLPTSQGFSNSWDFNGSGWSGGNSNSPTTPTWGSMQNQSANAAVTRFGAPTGVALPTPPLSFPVNGGGFSNGISGGITTPALPSSSSGGFSAPTPWR